MWTRNQNKQSFEIPGEMAGSNAVFLLMVSGQIETAEVSNETHEHRLWAANEKQQ